MIFSQGKEGLRPETSSNEGAENAVNRPSLSPEVEVSTKDSEGDAQEQHSSYVPAKKKQKSAARPYKDDFLKFGIVNCSDVYHSVIPMCVICGEKLANERLKPAKLERLKYAPCRPGGQTIGFFSEEGSRNSVISSGTQQKHNTQSQIAPGIV